MNWTISSEVSNRETFNDYLREGEYIRININSFGNGWDFYDFIIAIFVNYNLTK